MRVLSNTPYSVRSTVTVVTVLVGTFMFFHSYNWQLLPDNWTQLDLQAFGFPQPQSNIPYAAPQLPSSSGTSEASFINVVTSAEGSSEKAGTVEGTHLPNHSSIPDEVSQLQQTESQRNEGSDAATSEIESHATSSKSPAVIRPDLSVEDARNGSLPDHANQQTLTALESSAISISGKEDGNTGFRDTDLNATVPFSKGDEAGLSEVAAASVIEQAGLSIQTPISREVADASKAEEVVTNETQSQSVASAATNETQLQPVASAAVAATNEKKPTRGYDELSNLQKVELDLWQARAALKRVVLAQVNSTSDTSFEESVFSGEPTADVYRNAAVFRQSYHEMEQRFKVYVYSEGEEPLVHNGPCKEIYAVEGRFIQELQKGNPFFTSDPEAAHVYFLPFSVAMMVTYLYTANSGDMSPLLRFVRDYVHSIAHTYPYWTRSGGADHFMLACHDWGPHVSRAEENLVSKAIRVLCNANVSEGYVPARDASLPEIHLVGGEISAELGGLPVKERTLLAFFAGGDHGPVRPALFQSWEGKDGNILVYHQVPKDGKSYHDYMKSSKYCLCPGGYEVNSPRIVEAIYNECVPVVIADAFVLPFSDVLDWTKFSVQVLEKDIPNLKVILEAIPMERYLIIQERLKLVRPHFLLNQPPKRFDVFHMILHSVWLRRLNIRIHE